LRKEERRVFDKAFMLSMWSVHKEEVAPRPDQRLRAVPRFGVPGAENREKELERSVLGLLNRIS